jgi:conserved oligomeric Golgi complex subunit 6
MAFDTYLKGIRDPLRVANDDPLSPLDDGSSSKRANALSTKLTTVLSTPYADSEIREALRLFDLQDLGADEQNGRNLKALAEKEVIDANARIVEDFGSVAEVSDPSL